MLLFQCLEGVIMERLVSQMLCLFVQCQIVGLLCHQCGINRLLLHFSCNVSIVNLLVISVHHMNQLLTLDQLAEFLFYECYRQSLPQYYTKWYLILIIF